jgi:hypothetical protein
MSIDNTDELKLNKFETIIFFIIIKQNRLYDIILYNFAYQSQRAT